MMVATVLVAWVIGSTVAGLVLGLIARRSKLLYRF
jgi:hypothetical protein